MAPESAPPPPPPPPEPPASTPPPTSTTTAVDKWHGTPPLVHYASLVAAVLAPVGLLLPGRGRGALSVQNAVLGAGAFWSLNQVAYDYSGKSIYARSNERWASVLNAHALPEKARANRELMERERERRRHLAGSGASKGEQLVQVPQQQEQVKESGHNTKEEHERKKLLPEWKRQRLEEEREALKEGGKGISGMITDQIWEVWNQGLAAGLRGGGAGGGSDEKTKTEQEEQTRGGKGEKGE